MAAFLPHTYSGQSAEASAMPPERESAPLPPGRLRRAYDSLSVRLFIWLVGIMAAIFTAYAGINIRTTEKHSMQLVYQGANRAGEIIKRSTRHAMLLNRKEDVDQIITTIAGLPGVAGVRIYDKQGTIIVSADAGEVGRQVDMKAEACIIRSSETSGRLARLPAATRLPSVSAKLSRSARACATALIFACDALARASNRSALGARDAAARSRTSWLTFRPEPRPRLVMIESVLLMSFAIVTAGRPRNLGWHRLSPEAGRQHRSGGWPAPRPLATRPGPATRSTHRRSSGTW